MSASTEAARLANDRCFKKFGARPFSPEDYDAVKKDGRWYWGSDNGKHVDGYEVDVTFDANGGGAVVVLRGPDDEPKNP